MQKSVQTVWCGKGVVIGQLRDPEGTGNGDVTMLLAGTAMFILTAISPFSLLQLFPLIDSGVALGVLQDYGSGPITRAAKVKYNVGRIGEFREMIAQKR